MGIHRERLGINRDFRLPEKITPSEWSKTNVVIPQGNARPGRISYADLRYQVSMIDAGEERQVNWITYMTASQVSKTTSGLVLIAYNIMHRPRSIICLHASETETRNFLSGKFDPLLREQSKPCAVLCFQTFTRWCVQQCFSGLSRWRNNVFMGW